MKKITTSVWYILESVFVTNNVFRITVLVEKILVNILLVNDIISYPSGHDKIYFIPQCRLF